VGRITARVWPRWFAAAAILFAIAGPLAVIPAHAGGATGSGSASTPSAGASVESTATTTTPDATPSPGETAAPEATPTPVFAGRTKCGVYLHWPARSKDMIAVGFHQASRHDALKLTPRSTCVGIHGASKTKRLLRGISGLKLFQQALRGRGTSNFSAADCAMKPKATVLAPVTGTVTSVKKYWLYGRYRDIRLEIAPDASSKVRVVVIHITNAKVKKGARVIGGVTPVATVRHFSFVSAVNRYLSVKHADHAHIQINRK
jgi:hypothetical protein